MMKVPHLVRFVKNKKGNQLCIEISSTRCVCVCVCVGVGIVCIGCYEIRLSTKVTDYSGIEPVTN